MMRHSNSWAAIYHQMIADMCLVNAYHPDYAGGVVDKFVYKYYDIAHDLIFWKTQNRWRVNEK